MAITADDVMVIVFRDDDDATDDDTTNSVCFTDAGACGPVGVEFLQAGGANWMGNFTVEVSFVAK